MTRDLVYLGVIVGLVVVWLLAGIGYGGARNDLARCEQDLDWLTDRVEEHWELTKSAHGNITCLHDPNGRCLDGLCACADSGRPTPKPKPAKKRPAFSFKLEEGKP